MRSQTSVGYDQKCTKLERATSQSALQIRNASLSSRILCFAEELIRGFRERSLRSENPLPRVITSRATTVPEMKSQRDNTW